MGSINQEKDELKMYRNKDAKQLKNNLLKKTRPYFEICKRNINSEKKKKYEINEKILETDLNKKVLLELKYHELSSKIGWIQLSIIFASTAITFIQTADGVFVFPETYISTIVSISLSTYVALILAISRFFKFDESKEQIVNLLSTFALYINKLKTRKQILIDHNFNYYKRDIDHEYSEWEKLKDMFDKDGSTELKVNIDNGIDMLLTKKDILKYREEMLTLQLQEFIIEQQASIYSKMEPLMFSHLYKYKTDVGCLNKVFMRIFHTTKFHKKARDIYCMQEIDKVRHTNDIEVKSNELRKINLELKQLQRDNKTIEKVRNTVEDEKIRKKMEQLFSKKQNIREQLISAKSEVDDTKKLLKAYKSNQNTEKIYKELNKNINIEHELGIRDSERFNVSDIEKKEEALKNYNFIHSQVTDKMKELEKLKEHEYILAHELYYPDEYYGITEDQLNEHNLNQENRQFYGTKRYPSSPSSSNFSCSSCSSDEKHLSKQSIFNRIKRGTYSKHKKEENIKLEKNDLLENEDNIEEINLKEDNNECLVNECFVNDGIDSDVLSENSSIELPRHKNHQLRRQSTSLLGHIFNFNSNSENNLEDQEDVYDKV